MNLRKHTMTTSLRKLIIPLVALVLAATGSVVRAGWYAENVEKGADIVTMETRYPRWPNAVYFACWNMVLLPQGGSFYGGFASHLNSDDLEAQRNYRPNTVWSFWSDPHKYGQGEVLKNVYMHPEIYSSLQVAYGGEGTSGGCGAALGASWIRQGDWYRNLIRVWSPVGGSDKKAYIGSWIKDVSKNTWYHLATYRVPTKVTGFSGNAGFLEIFGGNGQQVREIHRRLGYYRLNGEWRKGDTVTIDVAPDRGGNDDFRTVHLLEDNTVFSLKEVSDLKLGRNLEPGKKHVFTVKQPAEPQLDPIEVTGAKASVYQGQLVVSWEVPPHSSPQLGYRIEVFDNPEFRGNPQSVHAARIPHVRQTRLDTAVGSPSVRLVVTDIYDREKAFPVPVSSEATLMPAMAAPKAVRPGVNYQYFEQADGDSDKAKQWQKLPDFENLKPKFQGIARGLDADFRGDRSTGFAFRYRGLLQVPDSGFHTLVLKSCDGSRIKIDDHLVLDNDGQHSATERRTTVALEKGLHRFECDWFRGYTPGHKEYAGLWLGWERPGGDLEEIPVSAWSCEDTGDLPAMRLVADQPTGQDANKLQFRPQIDARGAKVTRVVIFQNGLIWGESTKAPFEISGLLSPGTNRFRGRLYYNDGRTVDDPRTMEFKGAESDLSPWRLTAFGQPGLPRAFRLKDGVLDFVGEGDYLAHQQVRGDFTLSCRVDHVLSKAAGADPGSWMGLIVKETKDNTGDYFGIYQTAGAGLRGSPDTADYIGSRLSSWEYAKDQPWLRVVRRGNVFTSYSSPDGSTWTKVAEWMKPMTEEVFAGVSMRTIPYRSTALFRGTVSSISLNAGAPLADPAKPAQGLDALGPSLSGLAQSLSQPATLVARTTHGGLRISKDGGAAWNAAKPGGESPAARAVRSVAIHPRDPNIILCATGMTGTDGKLESGLWRSADGGATWRLVSNAIDFDGRGPTRFCAEVVAFDPNRPEIVVAAGETLGISISRDTGETWEPLGLAGERITCVAFHHTYKPGYLVVGTCADVELPLFGCGRPAAPAPKADKGRLYFTRDHGKSWDCRIQRPAFGITGIALRDGFFDLFVLATTRGVYTTETMAHNLYQRMEGVERDTPFTALGTDGNQMDPRFYAAPLTATGKDPVVLTSNWQRWIARPGIPAGAPIVAIKTDVADPQTLFIVRTDGILRSRQNVGAERIYHLGNQ